MTAYAQGALEAIGCECDPTDLRPDLLSPGLVAVFVENRQSPYAEDPDYDIWVYVLRDDAAASAYEFKNTWDLTVDNVARIAAAGKNLDGFCFNP